jgi:hypothetical protein
VDNYVAGFANFTLSRSLKKVSIVEHEIIFSAHQLQHRKEPTQLITEGYVAFTGQQVQVEQCIFPPKLEAPVYSFCFCKWDAPPT